MRIRKLACILILPVFLCGCDNRVMIGIERYHLASANIQIGDTKDKVLSILEPTQAALPRSERKPAERYQDKGVLVEIYYYRAMTQPDDLLTDDEFVPYVFHDGKLVGIGWTFLGGPKTQGQATPETRIEVRGGRYW